MQPVVKDYCGPSSILNMPELLLIPRSQQTGASPGSTNLHIVQQSPDKVGYHWQDHQVKQGGFMPLCHSCRRLLVVLSDMHVRVPPFTPSHTSREPVQKQGRRLHT